jgi:hypothetical protein
MASRIRKEPPSFELVDVTTCFLGRPIEPDPVRVAQALAGEENQDDGHQPWE